MRSKKKERQNERDRFGQEDDERGEGRLQLVPLRTVEKKRAWLILLIERARCVVKMFMTN